MRPFGTNEKQWERFVSTAVKDYNGDATFPRSEAKGICVTSVPQYRRLSPMKWNSKLVRAYMAAIALASLVLAIAADSKWN